MTDVLDELLNDEPTKWLDVLPSYQREPIVQFLDQGKSPDDVAELWLAASAANTSPFSAKVPIRPDETFLAHLKSQVRELLCGGEAFAETRQNLKNAAQPTREVLVAALAATLSQQLGMAAVSLAPLIVLVLVSVGRVTLSAWCGWTGPVAPP